MKNTVKYIKGFLEGKKILWNGETRLSEASNAYVSAHDSYFDGKSFNIVRLEKDNKIVEKSILVSNSLFLVFDKLKSILEADFSLAWKNYLSKTPEAIERRKQALRKAYGVSSKNPMSNSAIQRDLTKIDLSVDVKTAIAKGDNDGMPQSVKKAVFDSEEGLEDLDDETKERIINFRHYLEDDDLDL